MMTRTEERQLFRSTVAKWGQRAQMEMAQEEATELALACRKLIRKQSSENMVLLGDEIADVEIMIAQLKIMFPELKSIAKSIREEKLIRLKERVASGSFE